MNYKSVVIKEKEPIMQKQKIVYYLVLFCSRFLFYLEVFITEKLINTLGGGEKVLKKIESEQDTI